MAAVPKEEEDKVYVAEIVSESPAGSRRELNISMVSTIAVSIVFLLMAMYSHILWTFLTTGACSGSSFQKKKTKLFRHVPKSCLWIWLFQKVSKT